MRIHRNWIEEMLDTENTDISPRSHLDLGESLHDSGNDTMLDVICIYSYIVITIQKHANMYST